jgi:diguanylate cyclase (GGDEF)-like protein/PAS domain S-box-containing protein
MLDTNSHDPQAATDYRALNRAYATIRYKADGTIEDANHRFCRLTGYDRTSLIGRDATSFLHSEFQRNSHAAVWEALRQGEKRSVIELIVTRGGDEMWLQSRYVPVTDERGVLQHVVQFCNDATTQQASESDARGQIEALRGSRGVADYALDGRVLDVNALFLEMLGYSRGEMIGKAHQSLLDPTVSGSDEYRNLWRDAASGRHRTGEFMHRRKDGREIWLRSLYAPILDLAGRTVKIVEYAYDITEQRLRNADLQWQITAIHRSNCVVTFDTNGILLEANSLFLEATGYASEEICGRHHRMFVGSAEAHSSEYQSFWKDLRRGVYRAGQYRRFGKDGREIWLQATYNPIFDANGRVTKVVKYATVITDVKRLQADHEGQIAAIHKTGCVISFDLDGTVIDANENFLEVTGYRYAEVLGRNHSMFVDPDCAHDIDYRQMWSGLSAGRHLAGEQRLIGKDGRVIWLQGSYNPICDPNGRPFKIVQYAVDITAEKERQAEIDGQIAAINRSTGVVTLALDGTILDANARFLDMLGYTGPELAGRHHAMLVERHVVDTPEYTEFWEKLRSGAYHAGLYKRIGKYGREVWIQATYNPILDPSGRPSKVLKLATDVTSNVSLSKAYDEAQRLAQHDAATALPNRLKLSNFLTANMAGPGARMVVFYLDIDNLKQVNDSHGMLAGDRVLSETADRIRRLVRDDQIIARVGGDEFVIAAPGMPADAAERFCKRLVEAVTQPIHHDGQDLTVGISVGIAAAPQDGAEPDDILRAADAALLRSKQNGRGRYTFYASEINERMTAQRRLAEDMRYSLAAGHFYLDYQPRFDSQNGRIRSAEALVRWAHPERGRINPGEFIFLAERTGLIVTLGEWIMRQACEAAVSWGGVGVSVNVSPAQFRDAGLVDKVRACLGGTGLAPGLLELEITEGVLMDDAARAERVLGELKRVGVRLAMDDFGTGYSSLSYVRNFPFDVIKIDRSFIKDIDTGGSARSVVRAILALGKALGLSVTAEGVETDGQLAALAADQCDEIQGFLLARPLTPEQLHGLLTGKEDRADSVRRRTGR